MKSELKLIKIETHLGSIYQLPDYLGKVWVPSGSGIGSSESTFVLVNISGAALTVPFRIIKTIKVDGKLLWTGPSQHVA
jgi:hypothetical protein